MKDLNKQLWYKALDKAVPETYTHLSSEQLGKAIDVYTELIVKECAIIANRADNTETEIRCMYDVITEHFGVEE